MAEEGDEEQENDDQGTNIGNKENVKDEGRYKGRREIRRG